MEKIKYKGADIAYKIKGEGPCIVLLHGFCETHAIWKSYAKKLSKKHTVITVDLLGSGKSGSLGELHTMEDNAAAVSEILKANDIKKACVVGHSMGGYIAMAFAEAFEKQLAGIVLFHSSAYADSDEKKKDRMRAVEVVRKNVSAYTKGLVENLFYKASYEKYADKVVEIDAMAKNTSATGIIAALAGMSARKDRTNVLEKLELPVLFIFGKQDTVLPLEKVLPQITLPKHSEVLILDQVGHMGFIEAERKCLEAIKDFID